MSIRCVRVGAKPEHTTLPCSSRQRAFDRIRFGVSVPVTLSRKQAECRSEVGHADAGA
jgi:hypothetical protein